jgi:hypothetical protein
MIYVLFLNWKKKNISKTVFRAWILIWVIFIFFVFFPKILEPLIKELFIVRVMDLGMIMAFMVLSYITIENNFKIKNYEDKIEKLTRKLALLNKQKK